MFRMGLKEWLEWLIPITKAWHFVLSTECPMKISRTVRVQGIHLLKVLYKLFLFGHCFSPGLVKSHSIFVIGHYSKFSGLHWYKFLEFFLCVFPSFVVIYPINSSCLVLSKLRFSSKTLKFSPSCPTIYHDLYIASGKKSRYCRCSWFVSLLSGIMAFLYFFFNVWELHYMLCPIF